MEQIGRRDGKAHARSARRGWGALALTLATVLLLGAVQTSHALYRYSLYTDKKGKQVGDVVTVLVVETTKARNNTSTATSKQDAMKFGLKPDSDLFSMLPNASISSDLNHDYDGRGTTARNGEIKATVSVQIVEVMDNGNLLISGTKELTLNQNTEVLEVSGTVRPEDIGSDNTVVSTKIADSRIRYSGDGVLDDSQKPGLFTRFFNWVF